MQNSDFTHEEIVMFATRMYGENWRTSLAESLHISRKQLVLTLASGDPVPESITAPFFSLMQTYLKEQREAAVILESRLEEIRGIKRESGGTRAARKHVS